MSDLDIDREYRRGDRGNKVRLIQEWLTLDGFAVVPDGKFGPATETAVSAFQKRRQLAVSGVVNAGTFAALVEPMQATLQSQPEKPSLGTAVVAYAKQHLKARPREVGGENRGPWVRLYMDGNEGAEFRWCAGFACFVLNQACTTQGVPLPITPSVSCDSLAASAKIKGLFVGEAAATPTLIRPGSLFLSRRTSEDWTHVGIVVLVSDETFSTIEGNTNDEGSAEGYEVCSRTRGYGSKDFILI